MLELFGFVREAIKQRQPVPAGEFNGTVEGIAYEKLRSVYFSVVQADDYGRLSRIDPKKVRPGSSVDLSAYEKLNPRDFALLKRATLAELKRGDYIKTEWGNVVPTWHIAAAAMAMDQLGFPVDICVSGMDFLFPHLENVRTIASALTGKPYANTWLLTERIQNAEEGQSQEEHDAEPSKPLDLMDLYARGMTPEEVRFWLIASHYRKPIKISAQSLRSAAQGLKRIREFIHRLHHTPVDDGVSNGVEEEVFSLERDFFDALSDDLNTPKALAALFDFIRKMNLRMERGPLTPKAKEAAMHAVRSVDRILGLFEVALRPLSAEEKSLIDQRETARAAKDWARADALRDELRRLGILVRDTPRGPLWERIS